MEVVVKYLGMIAEEVGCESETITIEVNETVQTFRGKLEVQYPPLHSKTYRIAVNHELCDSDTIIPADAEIALLPAFAGG